MISASTAFMDKVNNGDIPLARMQLTTEAGRTIWIEDGQFWGDSISFDKATSQDGAFTVGSAVIGGFHFSLTNFNREFDNVDFAGAVVIPFVYFEIEGTREYLPMGVYYINSHVTSGNVIRCTALDGLKLMDMSQTEITYPITVQSLIETLCTANNITLDTQNIPNGDFELQQPSTIEDTVYTDRQMLSYACEVTGNFARMNSNGHLEIGWYDFENPVNVTSTFNGKSLWTKPITVTGIRIDAGVGSGSLMAMSIDPNGVLNYMRSSNVSDTFVINSQGELVATAEDGVTYTITNESLMRTGEEITPSEDEEDSIENISVLYGTDDYVIDIEGNPYVTISNIAQICQMVSEKIFAIQFRPGTLPVLANPCLQAGDVLLVHDMFTDSDYKFPITSLTYNKSVVENLICDFTDKEDADLRPSSAYTMRRSVQDALQQAQQADAVAQAARDMAETSGFKPIIVSDKGGAFSEDTTANLTATIYDNEMNEVDSEGTQYIYRWWITQDGQTGTYLNGGKTITVTVDDSLCDYTSGIFFETREADEGIYPFALSNRNDLVLTMRDGTILTARAAESVTT